MWSGLRTIIFVLASILLVGSAQAADMRLERAKAYYRDAAYDLALSELDAVDMTTPSGVEALEYRILCLLALERTTEAERTAEALVVTAPHHSVPRDFPPRYIALVEDTRTRLLPGILSRTLAEAREQYRQSHRESARVAFQAVLALSSDPLLSGTPEVADIRVVAAGFLDLLRDQTIDLATTAAFVPPVAIQQELPAWKSPDRKLTDHGGASGTLLIVIGADGHVKSATVERKIHPSYDPVLLAAARAWLYEPAMLDGAPVESEKVIDIRFGPTRQHGE